MNDRALLARLDGYLDEVPRVAALVEDHGSVRVFAGTGPWKYYARPRPGHGPVTVADIETARARQRELGLPERIEWLDECAPETAAAAVGTGLAVASHPLLVLERSQVPAPVSGVIVRLLGADDQALAAAQAAIEVGFGAPGTERGPAGAREREHQQAAADPRGHGFMRHQMRAGHAVMAVAEDEHGPLAGGTALPRGEVAELVGIATLPAARRRGLAGLVVAALVEAVSAMGVRTTFMGAADDAVARIYERAGFRRVAVACEAAPTR